MFFTYSWWISSLLVVQWFVIEFHTQKSGFAEINEDAPDCKNGIFGIRSHETKTIFFSATVPTRPNLMVGFLGNTCKQANKARKKIRTRFWWIFVHLIGNDVSFFTPSILSAGKRSHREDLQNVRILRVDLFDDVHVLKLFSVHF